MFYNKNKSSTSFDKFAVAAKKLEKASKANEKLTRNNFLNPVKKHVAKARLNNFTKGFMAKFERKPAKEISHRPNSPGVFAARLEGNLQKVIEENQKEIERKKLHQESFYNLPDGLFQSKKHSLSILQLNNGSQGKFQPKVTSTPNEVYEEQILKNFDLPSFSIKKDKIKEPDDVRRFPLYEEINNISKNILKDFNKKSSDRRSMMERDLTFLRNLNETTTNEKLLLEESESKNVSEQLDESVDSILVPSCFLDSSDDSLLEVDLKRTIKENLNQSYDYFGVSPKRSRDRGRDFDFNFDEPAAKRRRKDRSHKADSNDFFNSQYSERSLDNSPIDDISFSPPRSPINLSTFGSMSESILFSPSPSINL